MGIKNLPKPGIGFKATLGPSSFRKKLIRLTKYGRYRNLSDNVEEITKIVKENERLMRVKGGFNRIQARNAWFKLKKSTPKTTYADKYEAKAIFKYLSRGAAVKEKKPVEEETSVKASDHKHFLTKEQVGRNLRLNAQKGGDFIRGRQSSEVQFGGGKALVTSIGAITNRSVPGAGHIIGNAKELGIKEQTAGFAIQKVNNTKPTGGPSPEAPLKGSRPIGI